MFYQGMESYGDPGIMPTCLTDVTPRRQEAVDFVNVYAHDLQQDGFKVVQKGNRSYPHYIATLPETGEVRDIRVKAYQNEPASCISSNMQSG